MAALTGAAHLLGAQLAGMLSSAPVILSVLAPTTHRSCGPDAAAALLRGTLVSLPGTVVFATVLAYAIVPFGGAVAYPLAVLGLVLTERVRGPVCVALRGGDGGCAARSPRRRPPDRPPDRGAGRGRRTHRPRTQ